MYLYRYADGSFLVWDRAWGQDWVCSTLIEALLIIHAYSWSMITFEDKTKEDN